MTQIFFDGLPNNRVRSPHEPSSGNEQPQVLQPNGWHSDIHKDWPQTAVDGARPNFLCIGQPHAGTTWLHGVLATHPQVCVPGRKKDVDYFCFNYHLGEQWYLDHFTKQGDSADVHCIGEVGPMYIYGDLAAQRIAAFGSIRKLIVMLRDPVSWFVSRYHAINKFSNYTSDRALFLKHHGSEFEFLCVHSYLQPYLDHFAPHDFLFVTMDELTESEANVKSRLAEFLEIDINGFNQKVSMPLYNQARQPRLKGLYQAARTVRDRYFREFEWITAVESRLPVMTPIFFRKPSPPPHWLFDEIHARCDLVNQQTLRLGDLIGRDLSHWLIS